MFVDVARKFWSGSAQSPVELRLMPARHKARIGLALGSGVARGWAGIGVMRKLTEAGILPDVIAGTSIGAVVGGSYLADKLDELEEFARSLTPRRIFSLLDVRIGGSGLIGGERLATQLTKHFGDTTIESLTKPFVAVATELSTGHEIWLSRGRLIDALRASYALPGIFEPVKTGGRWMVDGALVNPVPVSACQAHGVDLIIAVNFAVDGHRHGTVMQGQSAGPTEIGGRIDADDDFKSRVGKSLLQRVFGGHDGRPGVTGVMMESFHIIQERIMRSRLAGDPPDIMIAPKLGDFSLIDFHRADELIRRGAEATDRMLPEIEAAIARVGLSAG
jgi:NTE family protein